MMTFRPDPDEAQRTPIHLPPLVEGRASLSPLEKSLLAHLLLLVRPSVVVETGVYRGLTTAFLVECMERNGIPGRVVGFDMPDMLAALRAEQPKFAAWENEGRLRLIGGELPESLGRWIGEEKPRVGFALLDARHDFPSVNWELKLLWPALVPEGIITGHDYSAEFDGVRHAFDAFAARKGACILPLVGGGGDAGGASLVAIRRPVHRPGIGDSARHRWAGFKADAVRCPATRFLWRALRPLLKRGSG